MKNSEHPAFRFIRGQGDLDGACLLYALFNARQALTRTRLTQTAWSNALEELHNANAFLDSTRGSEETDSDSEGLCCTNGNVLSDSVEYRDDDV